MPKQKLSEVETEGVSLWFLYLLLFVVGFSTMGSEISAARLIAPFFGSSTIIWANTISVVLTSLAIGYWIGGKLADRKPNIQGLSRVILAAGVILALVPLIGRPFLNISVDALNSLNAGTAVGSFIGILVLVAVPLVLLGACSPYAVRLAVPDVSHSGSVAGRLFAVSTIGSLSGTMISALLTIPFLGTRWSFLLFAFALIIISVFYAGRWSWIIPVAMLPLLILPQGINKAPLPGEKVLWEGDTTMQYARVVQDASGGRRLEMNEGIAWHSTWRPGTVLTGNNTYWDSFLVSSFAAGSTPRNVAVLGNGAGTVQRALDYYYPGIRVDGVEIDPKITEIGRQFFDLRTNDRLRVHHEDARPWLRQTDRRFDLIVIDTYKQPYIPFYLTTKEFFALVKERLSSNGVVAVNVGHLPGSDDLELVVSNSMQANFPFVMRDVVNLVNTIVLGSKQPLSGQNIKDNISRVPRGLRSQARKESRRIFPPLQGGEVYTDDRAPVEWLVDRSIIENLSGT